MNAGAAVVAVYGTLRRGERNHYLLASAEWLGRAHLRGALYDVPAAPYRPYAYPALVVPGDGLVVVELYRAGGDTMSVLDRLERYDPSDEAASQYLRRILPVYGRHGGTVSAYIYNGPLKELGELIEDGDWVGHTRRQAPVTPSIRSRSKSA